MSKILLAIAVLMGSHLASAEVLIVEKETVCGAGYVSPLEFNVRPTYYAAIKVDRPSPTFTTGAIEQLVESGNIPAVWLTKYTVDEKNLGLSIEAGKCYCVTGKMGGMITLIGFQSIETLEEVTCADGQ
jgi:hypothetical protein